MIVQVFVFDDQCYAAMRIIVDLENSLDFELCTVQPIGT